MGAVFNFIDPVGCSRYSMFALVASIMLQPPTNSKNLEERPTHHSKKTCCLNDVTTFYRGPPKFEK